MGKNKYNLNLNVNQYLPKLPKFSMTLSPKTQNEWGKQREQIRNMQNLMVNAMQISQKDYRLFMQKKPYFANKEVEAFYDVVMTSGVARIVMTVFDGNHISNTIIPAWRFEALTPFLNACKTLQIIDVYINAETNETSMWAVLVVDNKVNLYKEWLNDKFGIHSPSKEFVRKENQ